MVEGFNKNQFDRAAKLNDVNFSQEPVRSIEGRKFSIYLQH
jgi:hypothetical protein